MRAAPTAGTVLRLPLHTAFTLDLSNLLPPDLGVTYTYFSFYDPERSGDVDPNVEVFYQDNGREMTILPQRDAAVLDGEDPEAPLFTLTIGTEGGTFELFFTPPVDAALGTPDLAGTDGDDRLLLDGEGFDAARMGVVDAGAGDDVAAIVGASGLLLGRDGDDSLLGGAAHDALYGGAGADALAGGAGIDRLFGEDGDDRLFGGLGDDALFGGNGDDLLTGGTGNDRLHSGRGHDTLRGEAGDDNFSITTFRLTEPLTLAPTVVFGGSGADQIGTERPLGDDGPDMGLTTGVLSMHGGAGNDTLYMFDIGGGSLYGGNDDDLIYANTTGDYVAEIMVFGGAGDDSVRAWAGTDVRGGAGADDILVQAGRMAWGEAGNDLIDISDLDEPDQASTLYGGAGDDSLSGSGIGDALHGGLDNDVLFGDRGDDSLYGGLGNDTVWGGYGADLISGGRGADTLYADDGEGPEIPDLLEGAWIGKNDTVFGGAGNDALTANREGHHLYGGSGMDTLIVTFQNSLSGGTTVLDGGEGNDTLQSPGTTTATGGLGNDRFVLDLNYEAEHVMTVTDFTRGQDRLGVLFESTGMADFLLWSMGNGEDDLMAGGTPNAAWLAGDDQITIFFDANGDGLSDGRMIVEGIMDVGLQDFGILI